MGGKESDGVSCRAVDRPYVRCLVVTRITNQKLKKKDQNQ